MTDVVEHCLGEAVSKVGAAREGWCKSVVADAKKANAVLVDGDQ